MKREITIHLDMYGPGRLSQINLHDNTSHKLLPAWPTRVDMTLVKGLTGRGEVIDEMTLDAKAWEAFRECVVFRELLDDCSSGLELAVRAQIDRFENYYQHEECETSWQDSHSCSCDDRCPCCNAEIEPHTSDAVRVLVEFEHKQFTTLTHDEMEAMEDSSVERESQRAGV
jgi:hypothetical protein